MRFFICLSAIFLLATLSGCHDESSVSNIDPKTGSSDSAEPVRRHGNPYRAELTRLALQGLDYSSGRVQVDESSREEVLTGIASSSTQLFEQGKNALQSNRVIESVGLLTKAVILDSRNPIYLEALGSALRVKGKTTFAEAAFRTAIDINPESANAHEQLGLLLSGSVDRFDQAIASYETAAELDPENGHVYSRIAILNYYQNRIEQSKEYVRLAQTNGYVVPEQFINLLDGKANPAARSNGGGIPNVGAQTRVDLGNAAPGNETTAIASEFSEDNIVTGWNDYRSGIRSGFALSTDGGDTWQDFLVRPPGPNQNATEGDPMTAADNRTGTLWVGAISFGGGGGVYVARKRAADANFEPAVMAEVSSGADKCWMAAGPNPSNAEETRLYVGYNEGLLVSTNEGDSFIGPTPFSEFGLGWLPRVGPNGELYISYWDVFDGIKLVRSFDGGATLEPPVRVATRMDVWGIDGTRFPGSFRVAPLATMAVDPNDGTIYVSYFDTTNIVSGNSNVDVYLTKSTDQGSTWTTPIVVNTDAAVPGDQFFSWLEVDTTGRVHLLFYDTRSVSQNDGQFGATIEAYYAFSDDQGDSWTELVLTPEPFNSADDGFGDGFIGDYLGMAVTGSTAIPCYLSTQDGVSNIYIHKITNDFLLGDLNGDGFVNLLDVDPFIDLILNLEFDKAADFNGDGTVDLLDVAGFVSLQQGS
ncbi:MAG: dockerin type I domain-containing protein [Planctomycetota bacterium]